MLLLKRDSEYSSLVGAGRAVVSEVTRIKAAKHMIGQRNLLCVRHKALPCASMVDFGRFSRTMRQVDG